MAVLLGTTIMRNRGHAYVIITIAFLFLIQAIGLNAPGFTGGSDGITLPLPGWSLEIGTMPFYYTLLGLLLPGDAVSGPASKRALELLDEPSMGLDPRTLKTVCETVGRMHQGGRAILPVEQNVRAGLGTAGHGIVLESGQVRLEGSHDQVLGNPEIGRLYLGVQIEGS